MVGDMINNILKTNKIKIVYYFQLTFSILQFIFLSLFGGVFILLFLPLPIFPNSIEIESVFEQNVYLREMGNSILPIMIFSLSFSFIAIISSLYLKRCSTKLAKVLSILMILSPVVNIIYLSFLVIYSSTFDLFVNPQNIVKSSSLFISILVFTGFPLVVLILNVLVALEKNELINNRNLENK
jgi:hypothetical protein